MTDRRFYVITGGTMAHVAPHFSICAPAYGTVGEQLLLGLQREFGAREHAPDPNDVVMVRTRMALGGQEPAEDEHEVVDAAGLRHVETNEDLGQLLGHLVKRPDTAGIVLATAVCDWQFRYIVQLVTSVPETTWPVLGPEVKTTGSWSADELGKSMRRLRTIDGDLTAKLTPADKIIDRVRSVRKDIFLVGFKATTGLSEQAQYVAGLGLLKSSSCNLVFSNDLHERRNMVITPEEAKYHVTTDREQAIGGLCEMIALRSGLHFTRSTVVPGDPIPWSSPEIPDNLRKVVNHCIARGAYKPFRGSTVGHFATRGPAPGVIYTSRRKSNFNDLARNGLLRIETRGEDEVIAHGGKPSVGGQSQRIIFDHHPDVDCIAHFHCPLRPDTTAFPRPPVRPQRPYECGSHECGANASDGLREMVAVRGPARTMIKAVMLDEHGPNICFGREADPALVIHFIETFWDLEAKTGGPVELPG